MEETRKRDFGYGRRHSLGVEKVDEQ